MVIASDHRLKQLVGDLKLKIDKEVIKCESKAKLLGAFVDEKLSWADHIHDIIIPSGGGRCFILQGLIVFRPP